MSKPTIIIGLLVAACSSSSSPKAEVAKQRDAEVVATESTREGAPTAGSSIPADCLLFSADAIAAAFKQPAPTRSAARVDGDLNLTYCQWELGDASLLFRSYRYGREEARRRWDADRVATGPKADVLVPNIGDEALLVRNQSDYDAKRGIVNLIWRRADVIYSLQVIPSTVASGPPWTDRTVLEKAMQSLVVASF